MTRAARMTTTRTGITIGIAYMPRPQCQGHHAERIQAALLDERTAKPLTGVWRVVGRFWRWC